MEIRSFAWPNAICQLEVISVRWAWTHMVVTSRRADTISRRDCGSLVRSIRHRHEVAFGLGSSNQRVTPGREMDRSDLEVPRNTADEA